MPLPLIFVAIDCDTLAEAWKIIRPLNTGTRQEPIYTVGFKVGMQLTEAVGTPQVLRAMMRLGIPLSSLFLDKKYNDIPPTMAKAIRGVVRMGTQILNVHCNAGLEALKASRKAADDAASSANLDRPIVLGVTVLTSLDEDDLTSMNVHATPLAQVCRYAEMAHEAGLDGVIASAREAEKLRSIFGRDMLIVTPAITPSWANATEQKRVTTPTDAIRGGANSLVVGRALTAHMPHVGTSAQRARMILEEIQNAR